MLKVAGSIVFLLCAYFVGDFFKNNLNIKQNQLSDMIKIIGIIEDEIAFLCCDYETIKEKLIMTDNLDSSNFIEVYKNQPKLPPPIQWQLATENSNLIVSQTEKNSFAEIGQIIGAYQKDVQLRRLAVIKKNLILEREDLLDYIKTHAKMYKSLSLLLAVGILILIF